MFLGALTALICIVSACVPAASRQPVQPPEILTAQVTPALLSLGEQFHLCAEEQVSTGLVVIETPAGEIELEDSSLALRLGPAALHQGFAAQLGIEEIAVIVSEDSAIQVVSLDELRALYQGTLREMEGIPIRPWAYPLTDDVQEVFQAAILDGAAAPARAASTAPNPAAMLEAVESDPGAVGFVPARWLKDGVRVLPISGLPADRLRVPILAVSSSEPEGPGKTWLLCLQESLQ